MTIFIFLVMLVFAILGGAGTLVVLTERGEPREGMVMAGYTVLVLGLLLAFEVLRHT